MLKFTPEQELAINAAREGFNRTQTALAANHSDVVGNAAPIPLDAWRRIDSRGAAIQRDRLTVFNRLAAADSTPVGIGDLVSYFPKISDSGEVHVSMDGRSEGNADQAVVKYEGTPIPILDAFARFGWRQAAVSAKGTIQLDTATIANHQRKVADKLEDMTINGLSSVVVGGQTIYGLRTFPQRTTQAHGLTLQSATGAQWLAMFEDLLQNHLADNAFGRATIFLNYADYLYIDVNEFVAGYPKTIRQRLAEIGSVAEIVPASKVPVNEVLSVADLATGEWGTILNAMPLVTRPKARHNPEDDYVFGVMAAAAPQFKSDYDGRSMIVHASVS